MRPRPSQSGPRWWCRPALKVAATPCRCASTTIRLCESATLSGCQRLKEHVARDCSGRVRAETFTVAQRSVCAVDREGGGRWPVRPRVRGVPWRKMRHGDKNSTNPFQLHICLATHSCFQFSSQSSLQFHLATCQAGRRRWEQGGARDYGRRARRHWASPAVRVRVRVTVTVRARVRVRIAPRLPRYAGGTTGPRDWYAYQVRAVRGALGASGPAPPVRTLRRKLVRVPRTCTVEYRGPGACVRVRVTSGQAWA